MEWQTRLPTSGQKRPNDAAHHDFRPRQSPSPAQLEIVHAESSGSSRMLNGNVRGDVYHGNVNVTNHFNAHRTPDNSDPHDEDTHHNFSSVLSDSEKQELFKKLYFPQLDGRLMNLRTARKRTCEWLLRRKDYQEWMDMDSNHLRIENGFFWIRGNPGTGKSIAMKFLVQKMQSKLKRSHDELVLSFFFNARGSDLEKSTLGLYRSLLFGLLSLDSGLLVVFDHCSRGQCLSILSGEWEQKHERLLQELYENAVDLLAERQKRLYCYIDALDECPEHQIQEMVTYFEDIMTEGKTRNIRVCFSSRHYPRISIRTKLTITLEHEANHNNDIQTYIRSELRFDEHTDQIEVDRLRDAIFQKSAGIFLWVSLVVSQLNEVFNNDGRMDAIWERLEEIPRAAKELPIFDGDLPLYGLFQDIILKDERNVPDLIRLTQLIFCAKRPLRPQEAFVALGRSYDKPFCVDEVNATIISKKILAISKGLAEVTRSKEPTVQFIHDTVREFLRDGGLSTISKQSMQGDGNETLKITCLDQIEALDSVAKHFELLADYRTWTSYRNKQDKNITASKRKEFQEQVSQKFPFLEYATKHVLSHANAAAAQGRPQRLFLDSFPCRFWVPLHNLFEPANSKRFCGPDTPIPYILAGHGLNDLVRISTDQRNYANLCKNEQCPTALHNAIYNRNFDTAWLLVGLDPKYRSPRLNEPNLNPSGVRKTLLHAIIDADDVGILRKVARDLGVAYLQPKAYRRRRGRYWYTDVCLNECKSLAMVECIAEQSMLPGMRAMGENAQNGADGDEIVSPTSNLLFIRRAIETAPELLTGPLWDGYTMGDYALKKRFLPLFVLYFDLMNSRGLTKFKNCVEHAAMDGWLDAVKEAHSRGADLNYRDESGRTLLHEMFGERKFGESSSRVDMCSVLQYLLSKSPELGASVDGDGYTAFDYFLNDLWSYEYLESEDLGYKKALEIFVEAGAVTETGIICKDHEYPWVAVPWISVPFAMQLSGEKDFTKLDERDSLGRTALSWCFSILPSMESFGSYSFCKTRMNKGLDLLRYPQVDVNSRDNSSRTILEHLIRHPFSHEIPEDLPISFFKSSALDVNLVTSDGHSPLNLIISLYGTWPTELYDVETDWHLCSPKIKVVDKQLKFSGSLLKTAQLLLETKRVDISEQKRCLAIAPGDLGDLILESIRKVEPDYNLQTVNDGSQQKDPYHGRD